MDAIKGWGLERLFILLSVYPKITVPRNKKSLNGLFLTF